MAKKAKKEVAKKVEKGEKPKAPEDYEYSSATN